MSGTVAGPDGLLRCPWGAGPDAVYTAYHDEEWGRPVSGDTELFERISLEAFQSGLSWLTILRKREAFRTAFADFDPARVAAFDVDDETRLLADAGIVRNRAKVAATIANARAVLELDQPLSDLLWSFAPPPGRPAPVTTADVPAVTDGVDSHGKGVEAQRFPLRRAYHRVRPHAGDRHGRRPPRRLRVPRTRLVAHRPRNVGRSLARNDATAPRWSSVPPVRSIIWCSNASESSSP